MRGWMFVVCVGLVLLPQAEAAERCRAINVVQDQDLAGHSLSLTLVRQDDRDVEAGEDVPPVLPAGTAVDLCFKSSEDGFVSLWSHDADNNAPVRILPNEYLEAEDDEPGIAVAAGVPTCFSELAENQGISLQVGPPYGHAEIYLHFAESREGQIAPGDFPTIGDREFNLAASCAQSGARDLPRNQVEPYASKTLRYEVAE